jgi:hypothetical protein
VAAPRKGGRECLRSHDINVRGLSEEWSSAVSTTWADIEGHSVVVGLDRCQQVSHATDGDCLSTQQLMPCIYAQIRDLS